ncbi:MAG: hypothetical protein KC461_15105, partial [Dehalococcoidia bacterium]|nr:hypothetical protein [Dehalococcoidia bacterium]
MRDGVLQASVLAAEAFQQPVLPAPRVLVGAFAPEALEQLRRYLVAEPREAMLVALPLHGCRRGSPARAVAGSFDERLAEGGTEQVPLTVRLVGVPAGAAVQHHARRSRCGELATQAGEGRRRWDVGHARIVPA